MVRRLHPPSCGEKAGKGSADTVPAACSLVVDALSGELADPRGSSCAAGRAGSNGGRVTADSVAAELNQARCHRPPSRQPRAGGHLC